MGTGSEPLRTRASFRRNAFQETVVGLEHAGEPGRSPDIFSRACVASFAEADWTRYGYEFTQVFESPVLQEVAVLEGVPYDDLALLRHRPTAATRRLGDALDHRADLSLVELVNLASALVSVIRLELAADVLATAAQAVPDDRGRFEVAWLEFIVANRADDRDRAVAAFATMRAAIAAGAVPPGRVLDACTQAVVWYLKRKEISDEDFRWSVKVGSAITARLGENGLAGVSSWYRGLAMLPAAKGMPEKTRTYMERARAAAEETIRRRPRAYELNMIKTYHESSLKEHMYVTRDSDAAVASGRALIDLDPAWSISYGELAEAHVRFGRPREAAELYEQAVAAGPPYVGHHLLKAASCWEKAGEPGSAVAAYERLAGLVPGNVDVLAAALRCARHTAHPSAASFETALARAERAQAVS